MTNISARSDLRIKDVSAEPKASGSKTRSGISQKYLHDKAVRLGSLEPAHVTLTKQSVLPSMVVVVLWLSALIFGQPITTNLCALALVAFIVSAQILSPLDVARSSASGSIPNIISGFLLEWTCIVAILVFLSISFDLTHSFSRDTIVAWFLAMPFARLIVNSLCILVVTRLAGGSPLVHRFIIIGANDVGLELARRIGQGEGFGKFRGFFDYRSCERLADLGENEITCNCTAADLGNFVRNNAITRVYIALPICTAPRIEDLLRELRDTTASVYFVPNLFAFDLIQARCIEINGMPAFSICDSPLQGTSALWKRVLDVAGATSALLLLCPLLIAISIAIKRSSPGPILFKQRRYGLNGEEILVYKFRSMTVCEDGPVVMQATKMDFRVTPIGAFLRRTSMDELPQILNVLEGKMSFVGPRPHAVAHNEEYRKLINGYMIRHKVRPGITGWAQVNGLRGETSTVDKMHERVQYDLDYLRNWSLRLDFRIIARTAMMVLGDRNAY